MPTASPSFPIVSVPKCNARVNADDQANMLAPYIGWPINVRLRWESDEYGIEVDGTAVGIAPIATSSAIGGKYVMILQRGRQLVALTLGSIDTVQRRS